MKTISVRFDIDGSYYKKYKLSIDLMDNVLAKLWSKFIKAQRQFIRYSNWKDALPEYAVDEKSAIRENRINSNYSMYFDWYMICGRLLLEALGQNKVLAIWANKPNSFIHPTSKSFKRIK